LTADFRDARLCLPTNRRAICALGCVCGWTEGGRRIEDSSRGAVAGRLACALRSGSVCMSIPRARLCAWPSGFICGCDGVLHLVGGTSRGDWGLERCACVNGVETRVAYNRWLEVAISRYVFAFLHAALVLETALLRRSAFLFFIYNASINQHPITTSYSPSSIWAFAYSIIYWSRF